MKILHLVLFSQDNEIFISMYKDTSKFYKCFDFVTTIYYTFSDKIDSDYLLQDDILYIKGIETRVPGILDKTIKAFKYVLSSELVNNYDYIIRSNISTIIDFILFRQTLYSYPSVEYGGANLMVLQWLDKEFGIIDTTWFQTRFIQGTCIIFSQKTFLQMMDKIKYIKKDIIDDVSIGILFKEQLPEIEPKSFHDKYFHVPQCKNMNELTNIVENKEYIFYRNSNPNRLCDVIQIKHITFILHNKYNIISSLKFN